MKITKKVKYVLIAIWIFTVFTISIGTLLIGRRYLDELCGDSYNIKSLYSVSDPVRDTFRNVTEAKDKIVAELIEHPQSLIDEKYLNKLNSETDNFNTSVIVTANGEFLYSGMSDIESDLKNILIYNEKSYDEHTFNNANNASNDNSYDENTIGTSDNQTTYSFGENGVNYEYIITSPQLYLCNQICYEINGKYVNIYLLTYYGNYIRQFRSAVTGYIFLMLLIMVVLSAVLSFLVHVQFVKPLNKLKNAADEIGEGNLSTPVDFEQNRRDEIGELCRSFNDMRSKLQETVDLKMQYETENRELISNISHDLKTPITTIKGYVEGLMDGVADTPEKQDRYLKMIYNKANELDVLINELSLYTNITNNAIPYEFHRVSVKDYFSDCMEEIQADLMSHNMTLTYKNYCTEDILVVVDPDQLKRVINNIVNNAVKYNDKENGHIEIYLHEEDTRIKVSISDNGKGIDEESLPHIFDRTYRADSARQSRGGSGLGLAISKKIIEEHGGEIWATSQKDKGTTIYFTLNKYEKEKTADE